MKKWIHMIELIKFEPLAHGNEETW